MTQPSLNLLKENHHIQNHAISIQVMFFFYLILNDVYYIKAYLGSEREQSYPLAM